MVFVILFVLACGGLPYCLIGAAKALRDRDEDGRGMFTFGSCFCAGYIGLFVGLAMTGLI